MGNCKQCHKEVRNAKTHKCAKTGTKLLPCKQCSKKFSQASNLYQHIHSAHESNKAFQCDKCDKTFSHAKNLKRHKLTNCVGLNKLSKTPGQMKMKCDKCNKTFEHELSFKVHSDYCHSDKKCKQCQKEFTNLKTLRRHVISIHEKALIYECDMCDSKFSVQNKLHLHKLKEHENVEFKCGNCNKKFAHTTNLKKHSEKCKPEAPSKLPFQCDTCHRSFRFELTLKHHNQICHKSSGSDAKSSTETQNCQCDLCDSKFATAALLHKHILRSHNKGKKGTLSPNSNQKTRSKENISQNVSQTLAQIVTQKPAQNVSVDEEISFRKPLRPPSPRKTVSQNVTQTMSQKSHNMTQKSQNVTQKSQTMTQKSQNMSPSKSQTVTKKKKKVKTSAKSVLKSKSKSKKVVSKASTVNVPVRCQNCSETFEIKHELYSHEEKVHNIKRKFICNCCDSRFNARKRLSEHTKKIHDHKCDICGTKFSDNKDFIAHFETGMCESDTMAKYNDTLLSHCDICKMKFNGAEALEKHVQKFHLNKVNKRDICETMVNLGIIPKKDAFMAYFGLQKVVYYPNF